MAAAQSLGMGDVESRAALLMLDEEFAEALQRRGLPRALHRSLTVEDALALRPMAQEQWARMLPKPQGTSLRREGEIAGEAQLAESAAAAVERILSCTEPAIAAVSRRTEQQVRELALEIEVKARHEALRKRAQLAELRAELTDRAAALADHYEAVIGQLLAVEALLDEEIGVPLEQTERSGERPRPAVKMTLRERQRIDIAYDEQGASSILPPWAPPGTARLQEAAASAEDVSTPVSASLPVPLAAQQPRRWWRRWQREAA